MEMSKPHGIVIFGANGSGKTTLGSEVARILSFKHMDIEDYYFEKSEIPYTIERKREDCLNLMLADIEKYNSFVITAVTGEFGEVIQQYYKLAVHLSVPSDLRLKRIKQRGFENHGKRVEKGGDMYEQQKEFIEFAASRSLEHIDKWAEKLVCPVICMDGREEISINAQKVAKLFYSGDASEDE